ncbi:MAG: mRNA surveillance protein pelota [Candidatus Parvarchaeota archaeon]|nr:mRNA surveillance protein pelota [Candidatus Jingweiarchaeum tengchongense]MCW1298520.1 mRNA surveillance protein pelota [Candidatus Jingweiarchaeum tengchongense]MCW1300234.1 mRNA surveillance protein pelota [Candidatus Jingweiarchaeum tengchongense]MCW1304532.1 mRNA surveillance protein pelota [Candidatus Jingweiarchaeum tengchongense]MCW1305740.1 mRNA surveillance protein pelota [Candidatus Jingweiarchaeum tengchongense]
MQILFSNFKKGRVKLKVQSSEDLWTIYQIVNKNDLVKMRTRRKIKKEERQVGKIKPLTLKLRVEKIEFQKYANALKILGRIVESSEESVAIGSFHSFTIKQNSIILIEKEKWSQLEIKRVREAVEISKKPKVLIVCFEPGEAEFAVLRGIGLSYIQGISRSIPGKEEKTREKVIEEFYIALAKRIKEIIESEKINNVIIASLNFYLEDFKKIMSSKFSDVSNKSTYCNVSTTGRTGINEVIKLGYVDKIIRDEKISEDTKVMEKLLLEISKDGPATYGIEEVKNALTYGAVDTLLISEKTFMEFKEKNKFDEIEEIIKKAESQRARIMILGDDYEAGEKLIALGGIACLLRFKVR